MRLDPEISRRLDTDALPISERDLDEFRVESALSMLETSGVPEDVEVAESLSIPGSTMGATLYRSEGSARPAPALVYYHGGGWVIGSRQAYDPFCRALANRSKVAVISVDYRLAPEHRFPAAVEDCMMAARWVLDHAAEIGVDPDRIGVGGDSAGGNLAAACSIRLRDQGWTPACQLLIYPVLSARRDSASYRHFRSGFGLTAADMTWLWDQYLETAEDASNPLASPGTHGMLAGLPPTVIVSAEADVLRDEAEEFTQKLLSEGVEVTAIRALAMPHGFLSQIGVSSPARRILAMVAVALGDCLNGVSHRGVREPTRQ